MKKAEAMTRKQTLHAPAVTGGHKAKKWGRVFLGKVSARPVQARLMIPLTAALLLLPGFFGLILFKMQQASLHQSSRLVLEGGKMALERHLREDVKTLCLIKDALLRETDLTQWLKARDRESLLCASEDAFQRLGDRF